MIYPDWAPVDLIELYDRNLKGNSELPFPEIEGMVFRLITRTEMEKFWLWYQSKDYIFPLLTNGGLIGSFVRRYEHFKNAATVPANERVQDFKEIQELSRMLSVKLNKYKSEYQSFNNLSAMIPVEYDDLMFNLLSEENQNKILERIKRKKSPRKFEFWRQILPPVNELVESLANSVNIDSAKEPSFPRKINQDSALTTYLINFFIDKFRSIDGRHSFNPSVQVTIFVSVLLDDDTVCEDRVRKLYQSWKIAEGY